MITIENSGNNILLFGRNEEIPYIKEVTSFKPYFYVEEPNGQHISINGTKVRKIECNVPRDVKELREQFKKTYEADVLYNNRYIIDEIDVIPKQKIRICYIDIEIARTEKGFETPEEASNPILSIACFDSFTREHKQFCVSITHDTEKLMLDSFLDYIQDINPDMFIAWHGDGFDFPFIVNRLKKIGLSTRRLSRMNRPCNAYQIGNGNYYRVKIFGRICFDLLAAYKKISQNNREKWSLDYVSKYELGDEGGKEEYKGELDDLFKNDINKFQSYNKRDTELMVLLNEKLGIVDFFDEVRRTCFCKFEDVFMNSKIGDCLCLRYAKKNNFILPSSIFHEKEPYEGGFVYSTKAKLHKNIACVDYKSLYPAIFIGFNISYETILEEKEEGCINGFDKHFFNPNKIGIIPAIVKPLLEERKQTKLKMKLLDKNSMEFKLLDMKQYSLKIVSNAMYGITAFKHFRLFKSEVASSITYIAKELSKISKDWFENKGCVVIYQDTDSSFFEMNNKTIDDIIALNNEFNEYLHKFLRNLGVTEERDIFELEFEKVYKTVFFKRKADGNAVKKRYAGLKIWEDGQKINEMQIVGFESRRSDSPQICRDFIAKILKMIVYEKEKIEVDTYVEDFRNEIKGGIYSAEELGLPIGLSKDPKEYGNVIHARAARLANEKYNAQIGRGDKIKYIYTKNVDGVMAFKEFCPAGIEINYDKMIRRIIDLKIGPLYESLDWEYQYTIIKSKKKKEPTYEESLKQEKLW